MRPQPRLEHVGNHDLAAVVGAGEIHLEHPPPRLDVDLEERAELFEPGVVDQDGGGTEALHHKGGGRLDSRPVGDVGLDADRRPPAGVDPDGGLVRRGAVAVQHGDGGAVGGQPLAYGQPDSRATAGDDGDLALQVRCGARGRPVTHWIGSSPAKVVRCMSRGESGS